MEHFLNTSKSQRESLPGNQYFAELEYFLESHFKGEKHIEVVKGSCATDESISKCSFCHPFAGPPISFVPQPYPDYSRLPEYHYLTLSDTPSQNRKIDDYQPRKCIQRALKEGTLNLDDEESVNSLCDKIIVKKELLLLKYAKKYLYKEVMKRKRSQNLKLAKEKENEKSYEDFDWEDLYESRKLKKHRVCIPDKYLSHHKLDQRFSSFKRDKKLK